MEEKTSILQEAIAEAKQVRQAAIQNAYKSLEENLTPSIKAMLENKLEEELDFDETDDDSLEEANVLKDFKEVKAKANVNEEEKQVEDEEDNEKPAEEKDDDENTDPVEKDAEKVEDDVDDAEKDADTLEKDVEKDEKVADDTKLEDLTLGDLRKLIADMVSQIQAEPAPEGNEGVDMEVADVEGQGEEEPLNAVDMENPEEVNIEDDTDSRNDADDEEIDLAELLKELEEENNSISNDDKNEKFTASCMAAPKFQSIDRKLYYAKRALSESKRKYREAMTVISELRSALSDVNLLNAKLVYASRMLTKNTLTESQKANVIKMLDSAKSPSEVKAVYKTLTESYKEREAAVIKEHRSIASRSAGSSTAPKTTIVEVDPVVKRFQQLAGIIE